MSVVTGSPVEMEPGQVGIPVRTSAAAMTGRRVLFLIALAVLLAALPPGAMAKKPSLQEVEQRVQQLEQRYRDLLERVEIMESTTFGVVAEEADLRVPGEDAVVWTFDDYLDKRPFKVLYKSLDREDGQIELLLQVTGAVPDANAWTGKEKEVPVAVTLRTAAGRETHATFKRQRGNRVDPGANIHVRADIGVEQAALARQVIVQHVSR